MFFCRYLQYNKDKTNLLGGLKSTNQNMYF